MWHLSMAYQPSYLIESRILISMHPQWCWSLRRGEAMLTWFPTMLHWQTCRDPCLPLLIVTCVYERRPAERKMSMYIACVSLVNYNTSYACQYLYAVHIAGLLRWQCSVGAKNPSGLILNCADETKGDQTMHFEDFGHSKFNNNQMHGLRGLLFMYFFKLLIRSIIISIC